MLSSSPVILSQQSEAYPRTPLEVAPGVTEQSGSNSEQFGNKPAHEKCVTGVSRNQGTLSAPLPADLAAVVTAWPALPEHVKLAIKALAGVRA